MQHLRQEKERERIQLKLGHSCNYTDSFNGKWIVQEQ